MPTPEEILAGLATVANTWIVVAVLWHAVVAGFVIALVTGWRPSRRLGAALLSVPLLSVSVLAFLAANPFNGLVFSVFAVVLALLALRLDTRPARPGSRWMLVVGGLMLAFGWIYPHFIEGAGWLTYAYAAPMGLLPCPTLAMVIGFALLSGGFGDRAWSLALAALGLFYAVFGAFRLGVLLDLGLLIGAGALLVAALLPATTSAGPAPDQRDQAEPVGPSPTA